MAVPTCPKCGSSAGFLPWDYQLTGTGNVKLICCSNCGAVVGMHHPGIIDLLNQVLSLLRRR